MVTTSPQFPQWIDVLDPQTSPVNWGRLNGGIVKSNTHTKNFAGLRHTMNPWKLTKDRLVQGRKEDETFYALALKEFLSGHIRAGLMAKAIAASAGDEQKAKACYINLLASAIRDDSYLEERAREETLSEVQQMAKALSKAEKRPRIAPEPTSAPPSEREKRHMKKATKAGWYAVAVSLVGSVALLKNEGTAIGEAIFMALILSLILGFLFHILVRFTLALTDPQR